MNVLYEFARYLHVGAGIAALILFWVPALTRKGGPVHRRAGRLYLWAMSVVVATALQLSVALLWRGDWELGVFLAYLAVITFSALWSGWRVLNYKASAVSFRTPFHAAVGVLNAITGVAVLTVAWTVAPAGSPRILFTVFSVIGLASALDTLRFFRQPPTDRRWWWYEHFGGMIGSGIAAHTAFFAFGVRRLFPELQLGAFGLVPWVAPSIIGVIAIVWLTRHYRRKFAAPSPQPAPEAVARRAV